MLIETQTKRDSFISEKNSSLLLQSSIPYSFIMGVSISILQKFGMPGVQSISTDRIFAKYFSSKKVKDFETFHIAFINVCSDFNDIMPGKHFKAPPVKEILACYEKWEPMKDDDTKKDERKKLFLELMKSHVAEPGFDNGVIVTTGLVAPAAAMVLKKSGESIPVFKKFRLHLIPDVAFVPSCTVLALLAVKVMQINMTSKSTAVP